ncbi:ribonuclease H-like domain-containing protein, partial [Tanacetum coccineum]
MSGPDTTVELLVKLLGLLGLSDHSNLSSSNTNASKSNFVSHDNPTVYHTSIGPGPHNYVPTAPSPGPIPYYTLPAQPQGPIALPVQYVGSAHPHVASQMVILAEQPMYPTGPFQTFTTPASGFTGQKTTLPHAFAAGTLHDPTTDAWNMDTDSTLSSYKAHLVANGNTQLEGVDVDETFSLVVKPGTIQTVLSLAASRHWPIHQLDVKNEFLHGDLSEIVYMHQPHGFRYSVHLDYVCLLQRSLYGLKRAPRAWFQQFASYITRVGFSHSRCDSSLFIYRLGTDTAYLLLYVDDIVLTASFDILLQQIIRSLHQEFAMTDLGPFNNFLGISVTHDSSRLFLSQKKYAIEILEKAHMVNCNPSQTPVDTESKL